MTDISPRRLRAFRDAVIADMRAGFTPIQFRGILAAPAIPDQAWLERVAPGSPSLHVGIKGTDQAEYLANGQLSGPIEMVAHVVTARTMSKTADDAMLDALDDVITWLSFRTFGEGSGAAVIKRWASLWSSETDASGYALGSVVWEQGLIHGAPSVVEPDFLLDPPL